MSRPWFVNSQGADVEIEGDGGCDRCGLEHCAVVMLDNSAAEYRCICLCGKCLRELAEEIDK